jgi:hypothetical protein
MKNAICFLLLAIMPLTFADVGPKPHLDFVLSYNTSSNVSILGGNLLQCSDAACTNGTPLRQVGPQHFGCSDDTHCDSIAYGYSDYQKLVINFSDRQRESGAFRAYDGETYYVSVNDSGMDVAMGYDYVIPAPEGMGTIAIATLMTLVIELVAAAGYLWITKEKMSILWSVVIVNVFSVPLLWAVVDGSNSRALLGAMEIVVFLLEGYVIHLISRMKLKDALMLSAVMNLASIIVGLALTIS